MDDSEIIDLFFQRREQAVTACQEAYGPYCRSIALRILRQREDSEECVNDTWLHAWNAIPPARPGSLRAYLGTITRNLALNRYRDKNSEKRGGGMVDLALSELQDCVSDGTDLEETVLKLQLGEAIRTFASALSPEKRTAFILRYYYFYTTREIGEKMGLRENTVKSMLLRLRKKLKTHLEQEGIFYEA